MDQIPRALLAFPPQSPPGKVLSDVDYDTHIQLLVKHLNATPASQLVKLGNIPDSIFQNLEPSVNPLPFLYALLANLNSGKKSADTTPDPSLWTAIQLFVHAFDPVQVRYAGAQFKELLDELLVLASRCTDRAFASQALDLVQQAMLRLDPSSSTLTSIHLDLVKVCLRRKLYDACNQVLQNDILHFPSDTDLNKYLPLPCAKHVTSSTFVTTASGLSNKLTYRDHLQYFLYGGMVYIHKKMWSRALTLLESALIVPVHGNTVSMIQVEAYKKWILVSILHHGRPGTLPRNMTTHVAKYLNSLAKPYTVLAEAFKEESPALLRAEFTAAAERSIWQRDYNLALVRLVVAAHRQTQITQFSTIYSSINIKALSELMSNSSTASRRESPSDIEADIRNLVRSQGIHANLVKASDGNEIVIFRTQRGEAIDLARQRAAQLRHSVHRVKTLGSHVKDARYRLELSREYIEATKKRRKPAKEGSDTLAGVGGMQGVSAMDEDMLAEF